MNLANAEVGRGGKRLDLGDDVSWDRRLAKMLAACGGRLRGISSGDFQEALSALLGKGTPNLSASVIGRLKEEWAVSNTNAGRAATCDLSARRYVCIWADGVYLQARMEPVAE